MKERTKNIFLEFKKRFGNLDSCFENVEKAYYMLYECFSNGGKLMVCGNGGSAADSEHIVGELMKGFRLKRKIDSGMVEKLKKKFPESWEFLSENLQGALPAVSLVNSVSLSTAFSNDVEPEMVYAQQVFGHAKKGDVLIGISTSGNAKNVINAFKISSIMDVRTIGFTGVTGGMMKDFSELIIRIPEHETFKIQEYHLPVYHVLCAMIESEFFES